LVHGYQIVNQFIVPVGVLRDNASETCNKLNKLSFYNNKEEEEVEDKFNCLNIFLEEEEDLIKYKKMY